LHSGTALDITTWAWAWVGFFTKIFTIPTQGRRMVKRLGHRGDGDGFSMRMGMGIVGVVKMVVVVDMIDRERKCVSNTDQNNTCSRM